MRWIIGIIMIVAVLAVGTCVYVDKMMSQSLGGMHKYMEVDR